MLPWNGRQKRLRFVFDLSQSMARGNSWDGRLDRMVQTAVMIMEALAGFEHKFHYSMYGQSGSSASVRLWDPEVAPKDGTAAGKSKPYVPLAQLRLSLSSSSSSTASLPSSLPQPAVEAASTAPGVFRTPSLAERVAVVEAMYQHAASCASGDNTLPATVLAVQEVVSPRSVRGQWSGIVGKDPEVPADDYFVFVLRYGCVLTGVVVVSRFPSGSCLVCMGG